MFHIGVIDHVHLNLVRAAKNYAVHARAAEVLAKRTYAVRIAILLLVGVASGTTIASLIHAVPALQIAAVAADGVAFGAFILYIAVGLEGRVLSHRTFAQRLLVLCDRYRCLLAEIHDGLLDRPTILARRDELNALVHSLYEQPFAPDQIAYETTRQSVNELDGSDEAVQEALQSGEVEVSSRR